MIKNVALIGAGTISESHLGAYKLIPGITVKTICDMTLELAEKRAEQYGVANFCADYKDVLTDPEIDAVSIVTPTFTHKNIVLEALNHGKHVMCEKPPALTYEDALEMEQAAKKAGKVLMYGFVLRFYDTYRYLKQYIEEGGLGEIYYAEASRMQNCSQIGGWFRDKTKSGGGCLIDAAIHQLDLMLYFMGYPKVVSVKGYTSDVNKDLPERIEASGDGYVSVSNTQIPRTIESFAAAMITFEGGKSLFIKAAHIANTLRRDTCLDLMGDKGGASITNDKLRLLNIDENNRFVESEPEIHPDSQLFKAELQHFVDCCNGIANCIPNAHEGSEIMKILNAIYESAEKGTEILF